MEGKLAQSGAREKSSGHADGDHFEVVFSSFIYKKTSGCGDILLLEAQQASFILYFLRELKFCCEL